MKKSTILLLLGVIIMCFVYNYVSNTVSSTKDTRKQSLKTSTHVIDCVTNNIDLYTWDIIKTPMMNTTISFVNTEWSEETITCELGTFSHSINKRSSQMDDTS